MAVYVDTRYFDKWWPGLTLTDVAPETRYVVQLPKVKAPIKPCGGCLGKEDFGPEPSRTQPLNVKTLVQPASRTRITGLKVSNGTHKDHGYNGSLMRWRGELLLAYRSGWENSRVRLATLDEQLQPTRDVELNLAHPQAKDGQEDPRLFVWRRKLCVSYLGATRVTSGYATKQLFAVLNSNLEVESISYPWYAGSKPVEKNWVYFDWQGELFAFYSTAPSKILHVKDRTSQVFAEVKVKTPWNAGHIRGGTSPIRVGSEYWHWFHGAHDSGDLLSGGFRTYSIGVAAFEARPPFRLTRITPAPLFLGERSCSNKAIVFPAGAMLDNGEWRISAGVHDKFLDVFTWRHSDVEKVMVSL